MNEWYYSNPDPANPTQEARRMIGEERIGFGGKQVAENALSCGSRHWHGLCLLLLHLVRCDGDAARRYTHTHSQTHTDS